MTDIDEVPEYADGAFALAYGLGYDARLDELNRLYAEIAALKHDLERTRGERNRVRLEEEKKWKVKP